VHAPRGGGGLGLRASERGGNTRHRFRGSARLRLRVELVRVVGLPASVLYPRV